MWWTAADAGHSGDCDVAPTLNLKCQGRDPFRGEIWEIGDPQRLQLARGAKKAPSIDVYLIGN